MMICRYSFLDFAVSLPCKDDRKIDNYLNWFEQSIGSSNVTVLSLMKHVNLLSFLFSMRFFHSRGHPELKQFMWLFEMEHNGAILLLISNSVFD